MAADGSSAHPFHPRTNEPPEIREVLFSVLSAGLITLSLAALALFIVSDQLAGVDGELKSADESSPVQVVGLYSVGWHRLRLGVRDGEPRLDLTRFTFVGHVEYRGRRLDFHSGRVRFGDADYDDPYPIYARTATQRMGAEIRTTQDPTLRVIVEIERVSERTRVYVPRVSLYGGAGSGGGSSGWVSKQRQALTVTLEHLSPDGGWVVLGHDRQRV